MSALVQVRYLRALATTDSRWLEGGEGQPATGSSDTCEMPTLGGPCPLPGDHDGECEPVPPRCLCGHMPFRHVSERYRCRALGCGCTRHRVREVAP